jgi:hypothetical protein
MSFLLTLLKTLSWPHFSKLKYSLKLNVSKAVMEGKGGFIEKCLICLGYTKRLDTPNVPYYMDG